MFIMQTSETFSRIGDHLCEKKYSVFSMKQMICVETDHLVCMECSESRRLRERFVYRQFTWEEITGSRNEGAW